jgi:hypothetical protein
MLVLDFKDNDYDIYFNQSKIVDGANFNDKFYNADTLRGVKLAVAKTDIELDNLWIYSSDESGNPLLPDDDFLSGLNNDSVMCNMFFKDVESCSVDADCPSNYCNPNGKCGRFNRNYCDDRGLEYGNYCLLSGVLSCGLTNTSNVILDNFLLFIVFLIIMMFIVYWLIMTRRSR